MPRPAPRPHDVSILHLALIALSVAPLLAPVVLGLTGRSHLWTDVLPHSVRGVLDHFYMQMMVERAGAMAMNLLPILMVAGAAVLPVMTLLVLTRLRATSATVLFLLIAPAFGAMQVALGHLDHLHRPLPAIAAIQSWAPEHCDEIAARLGRGLSNQALGRFVMREAAREAGASAYGAGYVWSGMAAVLFCAETTGDSRYLKHFDHRYQSVRLPPQVYLPIPDSAFAP